MSSTAESESESESEPVVRPGWTGRFYEDFAPGDLYEHPLGRTISEADNTWFTLLTMNTSQMHFNHVYAEQSEFGRPLVVSTLTVAVAVGQSVTDLTQNAFANLGWDDIRMTAPVFAGDTLWSESLVVSTRESSSRPQAGIVTVRTRTINQHGTEVCSFLRTFYVHKRGAPALADVRPRPATPLTTRPASATRPATAPEQR
ncbi:MaoC family dehydratase [Streptomyces sp. NPDC052052]|uniref:MaoC family dehydratase n=1 Tax=Streptomyces sp. NPDC052052 TaxID=3154756 RepID=UPI00341A88C9